jgi:hypothetical protein
MNNITSLHVLEIARPKGKKTPRKCLRVLALMINED